ncbi:MAG TPA: ACT domain-containing protein [Actinomycetota bacterium]|nr:ACT domain-containing protein [Actinomycetota bacterium]
MDRAVRELAEAIEGRVALVALGGYGRREMTPRSDVDLMLLHEDAEGLEEAASRLFYPFWNAGIPLGHSVRTVAECVRLADDPTVTTALLDARLVVGEASLADSLTAALVEGIGRDPGRFLASIADGVAHRRERFGSCASLLEPDLKESGGGSRDVAAAGWVLAGLDVADPVEEGLLRRREVEALAEAREFLIRLRSALHMETGGRSDRLLLEHQPAIAEAFGFGPEPGMGPPDALMRSLFEHAREVEHALGLLLDRATQRMEGAPVEEARAPSSPEEVLELFAEAAERRRLPSPATLDRLERAVPEEVEWTPAMRAALLRVLAAPGGAAVLEAIDRSGVLVRLLPEWGAVRCRPQRDPYHRFTVDVHLIRTAAGAAALLRGETDDPMIAEAARGVGDPGAVLLGALLHDIGKRGEGPHVPAGGRVLEPILTRLRTPAETADRVRFLVAEHLLLSDTATRRDLSDENLVLDVAGRVGDPERLASLFLLTIADAEATGPHASTPWRMALVRDLVGKVQRTLDRGDEQPDVLATIADRLERAGALLAGEPQDAVAAYLDRLPRPYVLSASPEVVAGHLRLLEPPPGSGEVRTDVREGERPDVYDLAVAAADRPGLLADIAGALALQGLTILSAKAFTTADGVALDLFAVQGVFEPEVTEERWRRFRGDLRRALEGRISLERRVAEKRRHYPAPPMVDPEVRVDDRVSDFSTVVEVSAGDRLGLLFDLALAFRDLGLDVHVAKVATYGPRVVDAFYVRDLQGRKVGERAEEIREAVLERLA